MEAQEPWRDHLSSQMLCVESSHQHPRSHLAHISLLIIVLGIVLCDLHIIIHLILTIIHIKQIL